MTLISGMGDSVEPDSPAIETFGSDHDFLREMHQALDAEGKRLRAAMLTSDLYFLVFLRRLSRFGYFTFGPITLDIEILEDIVDRTTLKGGTELPAWSDDLVRFTERLMAEVERSGRRQVDELHFLLAFMGWDEGLPRRVFSELGITPEQVEDYAQAKNLSVAPGEKLFTPEEAAQYLSVHIQTVRAWIRSGRLPARRLAGRRALRISASDLQSILEPLGQSNDSPD